MAIEQYFEDTMVFNGSNGENSPCVEKWNSISETVAGPGENSSGGFDCNICLDMVQDPVVTLCGHLYCWPCIYKWLHLQSISSGNQDESHQKCPVCKAEISYATLVPLYGRGQPSMSSSSKGKASHLGTVVPRRPLGPCINLDTARPSSATINLRSMQQLHHHYPDQHHTYYPQHRSYPVSGMHTYGGTMATGFDPIIGMFGELVFARVFGDSVTNTYTYPNSYNLAGNNSPRIRRLVMRADKSLSRICFFLFCCIFLCLLLF